MKSDESKTSPATPPNSSVPEVVSADRAERSDNSLNTSVSDAAELLKDWTPDVTDSPSAGSLDMSETADPLADPATDEAVEQVMAAESDEVLQIEDAVKEAQNEPDPAPSLKQRLRNLWAKPAVKRSFIAISMLGVVSAIVVPVERYFVLNLVGVRSSSSVTVLDGSTRQPLKNTTVRIGAVQATTDSQGRATLTKVKLGTQSFQIEKRGFAATNKSITIGWGSNPLGTFELSPTGTQYTYQLTNFVSGQPIETAELSSGEATALSDKDGIAKLTIDKPGDDDINVQVSRQGYRTDTITLKPTTKDQQAVALVPARRHVFTSKRSGKLDLYSIYADGQQEKLLIEASGSERQADIAIVPHPTDAVVAYVSTRGNQPNSDGYLLSNLVLVDSDTANKTNVVAAERITILGWSGPTLVYMQVVAGQSARSPERYKIISYDYVSGESKQLAAANYINDAVLFGGQLYYAPNGGLESSPVKFYRTNLDGSNNQPIFDQEVWGIVRVGYEELALSVQQQWFTYLRGATAPVKRAAAPANTDTRTYVDSPDGKHSAWIDTRDGKGVLLSYELGTKTEKVVAEVSGLGYPVRWLSNDVLVYRLATPKETADYAVSIDGGGTHKLADVTPTKGLGSVSSGL